MDTLIGTESYTKTGIIDKVTNPKKKKVLIVDDQPEVRALLAMILEINDYEILFAENGDQALTLARTEYPDLILLDVLMPESTLSGLDVCRRLKQDPATTNLVIILLSAHGQQRDIEAGRLAGADDYIAKPFSPLSLINKIDHILWLKENGLE
jgi:CheY-like chemotaxis protein